MSSRHFSLVIKKNVLSQFNTLFLISYSRDKEVISFLKKEIIMSKIKILA